MTWALAFASAALATGGLGLLAGRVGSRRRPPAATPVLIHRLAAAGARVRPVAAPAELKVRLDAAGTPAGIGTRELMAAKVATGLLGGVAGALAGAAAPGRLGLLLPAAGPALGFLAPDAWLARVARERASRARRELPPLLDLLHVTVEAGSPLPDALRAVGERGNGPLAAEWRALGRHVALGVPLECALDELERRLPLPEVHALIAALRRARRHGAPLGPALAAQSRDARSALTRHSREQAARAGPKIQLVVALLLVPSVLLLVAAALVVALMDSGGALLPA